MTDRRHPRYSKGQRIANRFHVHQALMGGMGEVYLCLDEQEFQPVALKTFQSSSPELFDAFNIEVANWIALEKHPNIVRCFLMEAFENIPFMLLEWVAGEDSKGTSLRDWLKRGPLDVPLALRFTIDIVRGLIHANVKAPGIVHRDLKPDNVLVDQSRQAKITDFGLAKLIADTKLNIRLTEDNLEMPRYSNMGGTYQYMAPEQWLGQFLDFRTDIYAVGCILYELLVGRPLYDGRTVSDLRARHLDAPIPVLNSSLSPELKPILKGCLAKQRQERFSELDLLLGELTRLYEMHSTVPLPDVAAEEFTAVDYTNRGATFAKLEQHQRAISDYDNAIQRCPTHALIYANRGGSYGALGQHTHAIHDFDCAIELDPSHAQAYCNRGISYSALGQYTRSIDDYDRAIQLDSTYALAYSNRGSTYAALGQYERSIDDYDHAIQLDPYDATVYLSKAAALAMTNRLGEAITWGEKAARLGAPSANEFVEELRQLIGQRARSGDLQTAFAAFLQANSLDKMRQTVQKFPILEWMIPSIEQFIELQVLPEHRKEFEVRLSWLRQTVKGK